MSRTSGGKRWGEYYFGGKKSKRFWILEIVHSINQAIPKFEEIFDKESFYVFVCCIGLLSIIFVFCVVKVFKVRVNEHPIKINREWRDWKPANPFKFPWNKPNKKPPNKIQTKKIS